MAENCIEVVDAILVAQTTLKLTQQSYQASQAGLLQLLDAQRRYQQVRPVDRAALFRHSAVLYRNGRGGAAGRDEWHGAR